MLRRIDGEADDGIRRCGREWRLRECALREYALRERNSAETARKDREHEASPAKPRRAANGAASCFLPVPCHAEQWTDVLEMSIAPCRAVTTG